MKRRGLGTLGVVLIALVLTGKVSPMLLIFPLWIFTFLYREPLRRLLGNLPAGLGFVAAGMTYGMLIEMLAIVNSLGQPMSERVLLDGDPRKDLALAIFYYGFVIVSWWLLLRKVRFTTREVFVITGIYGIVVEGTGQVLVGMVTQPVTGTLYAILVMFVYGLFPMLALMVSDGRFPRGRKASTMGWNAIALGVLFLQYALYGNTVYPFLKAVL